MAKKVKYEEIKAENCKDILRKAIQERGTTQVAVADLLGMYQSGLSSLINRPNMTMYGFGTVLNAMNYDVAVVDRETGEVMWKVALKEER